MATPVGSWFSLLAYSCPTSRAAGRLQPYGPLGCQLTVRNVKRESLLTNSPSFGGCETPSKCVDVDVGATVDLNDSTKDLAALAVSSVDDDIFGGDGP